MGSTQGGKARSGFNKPPDEMVRLACERLALALQSTDENEMSCAESRRIMPSLLAVARGAEHLTDDIEEAQRHIRACHSCAEESSALREAMAAYEAGALPELAARPHFDLSFLDAQADPVGLWFRGATSTVRRLLSEVSLVMQRGFATFGPLPPLLEVRTVSAGAFRSDTAGAQAAQVEVLILPAPEADLCIQLSIGPVAGSSAALAVKIVDLESNQPIRDTRIALRNADRLLLVGSVTGQDGVSVFEQLPLGRYFVQLKHHDRLWEIPVIIVDDFDARPTPGDE